MPQPGAGAPEQSIRKGFHGCTLLFQKAVGSGSSMGYSGTAAPVPELTCLPEDWWDPAWLALQSPEAGQTGPPRWDPASTPVSPAAAAGPEPGPAAPAWGQVLATT